MLTAIAAMDEAYALSNALEQQWHQHSESFSKFRRTSFLAGRALLQHLIRVDEPTFVLPAISNDEGGKPYFLYGCKWRFNITHSQDLIAVSVGKEEQGVDLEVIRKRPLLESLKRRVLSKSEQGVLDKYLQDESDSLFFMLWTLRECVLKLSGRGIGGLESVQCNLEKLTVSCPKTGTGIVKSRKIPGRLVGQCFENYWLSTFVPLGEQERLFLLQDGKLVQSEIVQPAFCFDVES